MPAVSSSAQEHDLYGVLGDEEAYKSLHQRDSHYLSRYPSFHASPAAVLSTFVDVSNKDLSANPTSKTSTIMFATPGDNGDALDAPITTHIAPEPTGSSWFDQNGEGWIARTRKISNKLIRRTPAPPRPTPAPPVTTTSSTTSENDPVTNTLTSILIKEPSQKYSKTPKSAMKQQPAPLPPTALFSPEKASQRRFQLRKSSPSPVSPPPVTASTPYWQSPPSTLGQLSSVGTSHVGSSHVGSSVGRASVAYTSTSYHSSSHPNSSTHHTHAKDIFKDDGEPVEDAPRATLYVVNADPDPSESEASPVVENKPFKPVQVPNSKPGALRKKNPAVPPVPPIPPQFQAPPPPPFSPPASDKTHSQPTIAAISRSGSDRDRQTLKRHSSDKKEGSRSSTKPIPIPPPSSSKHSKTAHPHANSDTSSSAVSNTPYTPESSPPTEEVIPPEWIYPLQLTLEELFKGGNYNYRIATRLLSGEPRTSEVEIKVMPGWKSGTRVIFPGAGHERKPGVFQDMIFVVEQVHHERFARLEGGKLVLNQDIDLVDALKESGRRPSVRVLGLDGKTIEFIPPSGNIKPGQETVIKGHGMHIRSKGKVVGRGDLVIRWNVCFPTQVTPNQLEKMRDIFN